MSEQCLWYSMETARSPDARHFKTFIRTIFPPIVHHSRNSDINSQKHSTHVAIRCDINVLNSAIFMSSHLQGGINKDILWQKKRGIWCADCRWVFRLIVKLYMQEASKWHNSFPSSVRCSVLCA